MSRILVTGADGWLGSYLVPELELLGDEVVGVDRGDGDLAAPSVAAALMREHQPDVVVHMASAVGRERCDDDVRGTIEDSVLATTLVAQAAAEYDARLVYFSTSEVYGDMRGAWSDEEGPFGTRHNLYALVKWWGEEVCRLYAPKGLTVIRPTMPYGPGMPFDGHGRAAVMMILRDALEGRPITVHRGARRSWCYVTDITRMLGAVIHHGLTGTWNVGRDDDDTSMLEVARIACELAGADESLIEVVPPPPNVTPVKRIACTKVRSATGITPVFSLRDGMARSLADIRERSAVAA